MGEWLDSALRALAAHPPLQAALAACATFVLEDPTTVICGLLVAEHNMGYWTALVGLVVGIALGDMGLYAAGRLAGPRLIGWGPLKVDRVARAERWFGRNVVAAVLFSRFVPGMRLPTYLAAGLLRAPWWRFAGVVVMATVLWTVILLQITVALGEQVLPLLGRYRWPVALLALILLVLMQRRTARRILQHGETAPLSSSFEFWPPWLFYAPVALYWMWLALRHRGLLLPTAANPSIYSGGFIGESKSSILSLVPPPWQSWVAVWTVVTAGPDAESLAAARRAMEGAGLRFPVVAKPDVGQRGAGVRPLAAEDELAAYLEAYPFGAKVVLQELVPAPELSAPERVHEAGVLYWRLPGEERGRIFSVTLKRAPAVAGDGRRTLRELIDADPRARRIRQVYFERFAERLDEVLEAGRVQPLVFAGNHCQGTIFNDGTHLVTDALTSRIQEIADAIPEFHFGRFDLRFSELDDVLAGRDFKIIEINGAGAEATHIWDASMSLVEAYTALFAQFDAVFAIGAANRRRGHRPVSLRRFVYDLRSYRRLAKGYPSTS